MSLFTKIKVENKLYGYLPFFKRIKLWWERKRILRGSYKSTDQYVKENFNRLIKEAEEGKITIVQKSSQFVPFGTGTSALDLRPVAYNEQDPTIVSSIKPSTYLNPVCVVPVFHGKA